MLRDLKTCKYVLYKKTLTETLSSFANLMNLRCFGIGVRINDVDTAAAQTRHNQVLPSLCWVIVTAGTGIPSSTMQFISHVRQVETIYHLVNIR